MPLEFIIFVLSLCFCAFLNREQSLALVILVGFIQDPARKLVSGEPVAFTISSIFLLGFIFILTKWKAKSPNILRPFKCSPSLKVSITLFSTLVIFQSLVTLTTYQSFVMSMIGLVSYLGIIPALWLSWYFNRDIKSVKNLLLVYIACSVVASIGIYLSFLGVDWNLLQQVGNGIFISSNQGPLIAHTGFMRSPEIVAWHVGTAICLLCVVFLSFKETYRFIYLIAPTGAFLLVSGLLTGRRKMLGEVFLFLVVYVVFLCWFKHKKAVNSIVLSLLIGIFCLSCLLLIAPDNEYLSQQAFRYVDRGVTTFADSGERLQTVGFASVGWAINRFGYFGIGTGTAGLGMAHFGGTVQNAGGAGEGGLGKITVELGLPGLILAILTGTKLIQLIWQNVLLCLRYDEQLSKLSLGILSLLIANIPMFISSSLLFGDPFVLTVCGIFIGVLLAMPELIKSRVGYPNTQ